MTVLTAAERLRHNRPRHGTRSRYRKGCREACCREAETLYRRTYRARARVLR